MITTVLRGLKRPHGIFVAKDGTVYVGDSESAPGPPAEVDVGVHQHNEADQQEKSDTVLQDGAEELPFLSFLTRHGAADHQRLGGNHLPHHPARAIGGAHQDRAQAQLVGGDHLQTPEQGVGSGVGSA